MKYHHRPEDPEESSSPKLLSTLACRGEQCKAPAQLPTAKFQSRQANKGLSNSEISWWCGDMQHEYWMISAHV